jgi:hypothetical protein
MEQPVSRLTAADIQYLQRTVGNQTVSHLLARGRSNHQAQAATGEMESPLPSQRGQSAPLPSSAPVAMRRVMDPASEQRQTKVNKERKQLDGKGFNGKKFPDKRTSVVLQRTPQGSSSTTLIQLSPLSDFMKKQENLQFEAKHNRIDDYKDKYTTVGFEHEFAQMNDGRLQGVSHVEIAESKEKMPYTGLPFVLETDAQNALELVTPPFLLKTLEGRPLPLPDEVEEIDDLFRKWLGDLAEKKPKLGDLVKLMKTDGINFGLKDIEVKSENMTPKTKNTVYKKFLENKSKFSKAELQDIALGPITKGGGITTHVNFATDLETFHLMEKVSGEPSNDWQKIYANIETMLLKRMEEFCFGNKGKNDVNEKIDLNEKIDEDKSSPVKKATEQVLLFAKRIEEYVKAAGKVFSHTPSATYISFNSYIEPHIKAPMIFLETLASELEKGDLESEQLRFKSLAQVSSGSLFREVTALFREHVRVDYYDKDKPALYEEINKLAEKFEKHQNEVAMALRAVPFRQTHKQGLSIFLSSLARTLSGQLAVPALKELRSAQKDRYKDPKSVKLGKMMHESQLTSRVKDVHDVWIKDTIINLGLGVLSTKEWQIVRQLSKNQAFRNYVATGLPDIKEDSMKISSATYSPSILGALDQLESQIDKYKLDQSNTESRSKVTPEKNFINPESRPKLFSHDSKWIGPRQDTYIPAKNVQMPLWENKRLHVVESRRDSVEKLHKVKELYGINDKRDLTIN